jgi:hypothetical protein
MGCPGAIIEVLESLEYDDKKDLYKKERHHILENIEDCCNIQHPTRTHHEYYLENNQSIKYYQNMVITCDICDKTYTRRNKARHNKFYCKMSENIIEQI